jgi:hypothetical protein
MYCSIQEAWPEHNFGKDKIDNVANQNVRTAFSNKNYIQQNNSSVGSASSAGSISYTSDNIEHFTSNTTCKSFIEHLEKCPECKSKLNNNLSTSFSNLVEKLTLNPELRETVVVFLIGILVLLILNLLFK